MATVTGLLRAYKLGTNAEIIKRGSKLGKMPESGMPAVGALARGKPVKLSGVEHRKQRMLARDKFLTSLSRVNVGLPSAAVNVVWAPPKVSPWSWPQERTSEQVVVQIHGSRRWTVCARGTPKPTNTSKAAEADMKQTKGGSS